MRRRRLGALVEQALPGQQQVVVVAGVRRALALRVPLEDADDLLLEREEVRRAVGQDLGKRPAGVDREGVQIEEHVAAREPLLRDRDLLVGDRRVEHLAAVLGVEDREVRPDADPRPEPAQQAAADRVKRPPHEAARVDRQQRSRRGAAFRGPPCW